MWSATITFLVIVLFIVLLSMRSSKEQPASLQQFQSFAPILVPVYSPKDIRELIANDCKIPYIFLSNDDIDYFGIVSTKTECQPVEDIVYLKHDGTIQLFPRTPRYFSVRNVSCVSQDILAEANGDQLDDWLGEIRELDFLTEQIMNSTDFVVKCYRDNELFYLKPFINFARDTEPEPDPNRVIILMLPSVHYKFFMKFMYNTRKFMTELEFSIFKMLFTTDETPITTFRSMMGLSGGMDVIEKAAGNGYQTFYSGPDLTRGEFKNNFTETTQIHKSFINSQYLEPTNNLCLNDGRTTLEDDLDILEKFTTATSGSSWFSTHLISDIDWRRRTTDDYIFWSLSKIMTKQALNHTTFVIMSYETSNRTELTEDEKNQLVAVRLSDSLRFKYPEMANNLERNSNRLSTPAQINALLTHLAYNNLEEFDGISPLNHLNPSTNMCADVGIADEDCNCLIANQTSPHAEQLTQEFLNQTREDIETELRVLPCVLNIDIENDVDFYLYRHNRKGRIRGAEFKIHLTIETNGELKNVTARKFYKYEPYFTSFNNYDVTRLMNEDGTNSDVRIVCD